MHQETCGFIGLFPQTTTKKPQETQTFFSRIHPLIIIHEDDATT
jgi:hypothetical protein